VKGTLLPGRTVVQPRPFAKDYAGKAREFLAEAEDALGSERFDAAILNAIHAGISSADAVSVALAGVRSSDPDHDRAIDLLKEVASGSSELPTKARQLQHLLQRKSTVGYQSRRATRHEADDAVTRARRLVEWAERQVALAKL
jgi:HEPN domain